MNIKLLKEDLIGFREDAKIIVDGKSIKGLQSLDNGNLYISTEFKIGECTECGHPVYHRIGATGDSEYIGYCPNCETNKTEFQIIISKFLK